MLNSDIASQFRFELDPAERILWAGQPRQGWMLHPQDIFMIPFSLLWGGFAIFWFASVLFIGENIFFALFGVPFVLVGLYLIFGRFLYDRWARKNTFYALTNQRILIRNGGRVASLTSIHLTAIPEITFQEHREGRASFFFSAVPPQMGFSSARVRSQAGPFFDQIENGQQVYQTLRRAQQDALRDAGKAG
ncbi:MAG: PH domain-containing protein [Chloroflexi bacterium]|nr:PH domain-containing protein [Chloroflexota bacterium]